VLINKARLMIGKNPNPVFSFSAAPSSSSQTHLGFLSQLLPSWLTQVDLAWILAPRWRSRAAAALAAVRTKLQLMLWWLRRPLWWSGAPAIRLGAKTNQGAFSCTWTKCFFC
jgi:hypothetical protein